MARTFGQLGGKHLSQIISQALEQAFAPVDPQAFHQPGGQPDEQE